MGRHLAVTCDLRSQGLFDELLDAVAALEEREMSCDIVFLEASDEVLIRRYSEIVAAIPLQSRGRPRPTLFSVNVCSCRAFVIEPI